MSSDPKVLVVGAGPTGLVLASELHRHGVSCRIVDKSPGPATESRALAIHARTLELFETFGAAHEAVSRGRKVHAINVWSGGKRITHVEMDELESRHAYILVLPQSETEAILAKCLERHGGRIERPLELASLVQKDDGVEAMVARPDGRLERVHAAWLVGCDGARSAVRKALEIPFDGVPYEERFVLADLSMPWPHADDESHAFFSPDGPLIVLPLPGDRYRVIALLPEGGDTPKTADEFRALVKARAAVDALVSEIAWTSEFRIHRRIVPTYRKGRAFLAGDAAHIHSPIGGQGMNTGIQDAYNLAWKLALVVRGEARPELLDSYEAERRPIAAATLTGTDVATKVVTLRNPIAREIRDHVAGLLSSLEVVQERATRATAGLANHYRASPIVDEDRASVFAARLTKDESDEAASVRDWLDFGAAPAPGDRAPDVEVRDPRPHGAKRLHELLRGTKHVVLLFDGAAPTEAGYRHLASIAARIRARHDSRVTVRIVVPTGAEPAALADAGDLVLDASRTLHRRFGAGAECAYVIRPDGYVGYRCQPADGEKLDAWLARIFVA